MLEGWSICHPHLRPHYFLHRAFLIFLVTIIYFRSPGSHLLAPPIITPLRVRFFRLKVNFARLPSSRSLSVSSTFLSLYHRGVFRFFHNALCRIMFVALSCFLCAGRKFGFSFAAEHVRFFSIYYSLPRIASARSVFSDAFYRVVGNQGPVSITCARFFLIRAILFT